MDPGVEIVLRVAEAISVLGGMAIGYTRLVYRLGKQDGEMRKYGDEVRELRAEMTARGRRMSLGLEWNNEVTQLMAQRTGTLPPGSIPPPRPRVTTLSSEHLRDENDDAWSEPSLAREIDVEAEKLRRNRERGS